MLQSEYLARTQRLLQNPPALSSLYATSDLYDYINQGRDVVAAETECVRAVGTLPAAQGVGVFSFSSITLSGSGYEEPLSIRQIWVSLGSGRTPMYARPFPWFSQYSLGAIVQDTGIPKNWAQQGQGADGTLYVYPIPDWTRNLILDLTAVPADLTSDASVDVIPDLFTLAVPYYAAYLAYLSAQRPDDAGNMFQKYRDHSGIARASANGYVLPYQGAQPSDPAAAGRFPKQTGG